MNRNPQKNVAQIAQTHRANILKSLEHRLEVARAKGETSLIAQLEAERKYYDQ